MDRVHRNWDPGAYLFLQFFIFLSHFQREKFHYTFLRNCEAYRELKGQLCTVIKQLCLFIPLCLLFSISPIFSYLFGFLPKKRYSQILFQLWLLFIKGLTEFCCSSNLHRVRKVSKTSTQNTIMYFQAHARLDSNGFFLQKKYTSQRKIWAKTDLAVSTQSCRLKSV